MEHALAVSLLLISALCAACHRLLIKLSMDRLVLFAGLNGVAVLVGLIAVWFVPPIPWRTLPYLLASSAFYTAAMYFLARGYERSDFSVITPLQGALKALVIAALAVAFLNEQARIHHWIAVALIVLAFLVQTTPSSLLNPHRYLTLALALSVGLFSGCQYVADIAGIRSVESPFSYLVWNLFIGLPIVLYGLGRRPRAALDQLIRQKRPILLGSALDMVGYAIILYIVYHLAMLDVLPIVNLDILFVTVLGLVLLGERFAFRRILASLLLLAGALIVELI